MGLKETAVKSTIWKTLENTVSQLLSFAVFLVLARILNPEAYGVIALAGVFIASLSALSAFGIEQTVIQLEKPLPEYLSSAFYLSCILSVTIYLILALGAAAIARLFSVPQLEDILPWLGLSVIINSLCAVPRGILTRNFMFKYLALRSITAITIGGVAGIWMALVGYNEWALVGQQLAMAASSTIILFASCRWFPTVRFSWRYISDTLSFSLNVLGSQLMGTATRQADNLLIGVFLGSTALGIYSIGYKIFDTATQVILDSMSSIAFPAFSRVQGDLEKMRAVYYSIVISSTAITIPCFVMLILLSEQLVPAVFGEQWRGSGPVLQYLMIAACISSITFFNSSLLLALGRARAIFKLGLLNTSLNIIAFLIAVRWGIVAVAAAFAIRAIVTFPVSMYLLKRYTSITFTSLIIRMKGHCAALLCLFLAVTIAGDRTNDLSVWLRLLAQINIGGIAYITTLYLFDRALCKQLFSLVIAATKRP